MTAQRHRHEDIYPDRPPTEHQHDNPYHPFTGGAVAADDKDGGHSVRRPQRNRSAHIHDGEGVGA